MKMKLAILGSGEYAQQIVDYVEESDKYRFVGFVDSTQKIGNKILNYPILSHDDDIFNLYKDKIIDCVFIGVGYAQFGLKRKLYQFVKGRIPLATIIHSTAIIYPRSHIGEGVLVGSYVIIGKECNIEDNVVINNGALIEHNAILKKHSYISCRAALAGYVSIGESCFLGINSIVRDHIVIDDNSEIGMGSVIINNVGKKEVWVGNPGRLLRKI